MPSIILSDNGVSSGSAGLKTTAASDGALVLQTSTSGGTATTAVTIGTDQSVTFAQAANLPNTFGFKNRIINGNMTIDQRNAGASVTITANAYTLDRWLAVSGQSSKFSVRQTPSATETGYATRVGAGFKNYLAATSLSAYSIVSGDIFALAQGVEGFNVADLAWGTANAKAVTLSFWAYSSLTGTFGGTVKNAMSGATRSYPFSYTISAANTWEYKTITIAGDTSGTWATDNSCGLEIGFGLGVASDYSSAAGSWAAGNYWSATGATSVVGTNGATFYITGVQLEKGSTATSFDFRSYGTELALCQRYYWRWTANYSSHPLTVFQAYSSTSAWGKLFDLPVTMRATPTASTSGSFGATNAAASSITNFTATNIAQNTANMLATGAWTGSSGLVAGNATVVVAAAAGNYIDASAEL